MNIHDPITLPDIQAGPELRNLPIEAVGISRLKYPLRVCARGADMQTVGDWSMSVSLAAADRGTHMSRFVELLEDRTGILDHMSFRTLAFDMLERLHADSGELSVNFPFFMRKEAPVSGALSWLDHNVTWFAQAEAGGCFDFRMRVGVPVTTLCPCSKEISRYGAHNQRSLLTLEVETQEEIAIEELVGYAERSASSELFGLLKRPDEKLVTERAYRNPRFVEDLVREAALQLEGDRRVLAYTIEAENYESIHNHSAVARITGPALPRPSPSTRRNEERMTR